MNPYQRYAETNLLSNSPLELVVALYRGALDAVLAACRFNERGEHSARGAAVSNAIDLLTELTVSLDLSVEGTLVIRLAELYEYMRARLLEAHAEASQSKLAEVSGLLSTLSSAWQHIAAPAPVGDGYFRVPGAAISASEEIAPSAAVSRV